MVKLTSAGRIGPQLCLNKLVYPISAPEAARNFVLVIISEQISFQYLPLMCLNQAKLDIEAV